MELQSFYLYIVLYSVFYSINMIDTMGINIENRLIHDTMLQYVCNCNYLKFMNFSTFFSSFYLLRVINLNNAYYNELNKSNSCNFFFGQAIKLKWIEAISSLIPFGTSKFIIIMSSKRFFAWNEENVRKCKKRLARMELLVGLLFLMHITL